ncbi:hypothetical protein EDC04DRAFT_2614881 [Pisolithus marmoratus]|nr:hypothetical protein EDC04DRAFT_2614881 [Pisolithus marmoratus]
MLFGTLKGNITYVLCIEDSSIGTLVIPQSLPYQSVPQSLSNGWSIFDVDLARGHGLEVTVSTSDKGHPIAYCEGKEYYYGCSLSYFPMKWVKVVSVPLPDKIAWFSLASVDPPLANCMLTRFSAQWWEDGDTGQICYDEFAGKLACIIMMDGQCKSVTVCVSTESSSDEVVEALEISIHDFKLEFPTGTSVQVITGLNSGFQGIVIGKVDDMCILQGTSHISPTTYTSQEPDNQLPDDPLIYESHVQPGDFICVISGPHKGLCSMLHWHNSCEILITPSMLQQADPDNLRDKGKSRAQEPKVPSSNGNIDEGSDLIQVSVSMDKVLIMPPSTQQFSREKGYDVTICDHVHLFVLLTLYLAILQFWLMMVHCSCIKLENHSLCDIECQLKNTAVITDTTPPMSQLTVDPSAKPGPSTLACNPWVPHSDDITPQPLNKLAQADTDYRCVPWLFDNNFCDYANWHVCLRVAMSYNHGLLLNHCDLKYTCDLTPTNPRSAGCCSKAIISIYTIT